MVVVVVGLDEPQAAKSSDEVASAETTRALASRDDRRVVGMPRFTDPNLRDDAGEQPSAWTVRAGDVRGVRAVDAPID